MATKLMFAVLDKAADCFMVPFFTVAEGVAVRDFLNEATNPESMLCKHAKDFSLYRLGSFDDATGGFTIFPEPQFVISALLGPRARAEEQPELPFPSQVEH